MKEIITGSSFINYCGFVLVFVILYLITFFLCKIQGLTKDMIESTLKDIVAIKKSLNLFLSSHKATLKRDKARKLMVRIRLFLKNAQSTLLVYQYEEEEDPAIGSAIKRIDSILACCNDIALYYNTNEKEALSLELKKALSMAEDVEKILFEIKKEKEEKRLQVI